MDLLNLYFDNLYINLLKFNKNTGFTYFEQIIKQIFDDGSSSLQLYFLWEQLRKFHDNDDSSSLKLDQIKLSKLHFISLTTIAYISKEIDDIQEYGYPDYINLYFDVYHQFSISDVFDTKKTKFGICHTHNLQFEINNKEITSIKSNEEYDVLEDSEFKYETIQTFNEGTRFIIKNNTDDIVYDYTIKFDDFEILPNGNVEYNTIICDQLYNSERGVIKFMRELYNNNLSFAIYNSEDNLHSYIEILSHDVYLFRKYILNICKNLFGDSFRKLCSIYTIPRDIFINHARISIPKDEKLIIEKLEFVVNKQFKNSEIGKVIITENERIIYENEKELERRKLEKRRLALEHHKEVQRKKVKKAKSTQSNYPNGTLGFYLHQETNENIKEDIESNLNILLTVFNKNIERYKSRLDKFIEIEYEHGNEVIPAYTITKEQLYNTVLERCDFYDKDSFHQLSKNMTLGKYLSMIYNQPNEAKQFLFGHIKYRSNSGKFNYFKIFNSTICICRQ